MTVLRRTTLSIALLGTLAACGGSSNPLGNPPVVSNPQSTQGNQHLSFAYFQKCINPIFLAQLPDPGNVDHQHLRRRWLSRHSDRHRRRFSFGAGARRRSTSRDPANTPDVIRATDIYKNFYSAQGDGRRRQHHAEPARRQAAACSASSTAAARSSRDENDPNIKLIKYWITHPAPLGQDEFSTATYTMFTPADPKTGTCNTQ